MDDLSPPKFFIVSACAVRVRGSEVEVVHGNGRLIMTTCEEAYELAMGQALARYRPDEGWSQHDVVVNELLADNLQLAHEVLGMDDLPPVSADDSSEQVM